MLWILLLGVLGLLAWYKFIKPLKHFSKLGIQHTKPLPLFGDQFKMVFRQLSFLEVIEMIYNKFPEVRYAGFFQFTIPTLMIRDPELIKQITIKDFDHFIDHRVFADTGTDPLMAGNLFSLKGQKWREMRATLSGSFTSSKMKNMFHLMNETAEDFVNYFIAKEQDIIEIELKDNFTKYTNDVIASTAFGVKVDSINNPKNEFYLMGKKATNLNGLVAQIRFFGTMIIPKVFKLLKIGIFPKEASDFFRSVVNQSIKHREQEIIVRPDMIGQMLEVRKGVKQVDEDTIDTGFATVNEATNIHTFKQKKYLTNEDIACQAFLFFFAGFDAISTALCFGSYELAVNKDVQHKLRKEILENHNYNNGILTYETLLKMKYMDMVVSEMLRKWPPGIGTDRTVTQPYTIQPLKAGENKVHLQKGDLVFIPIIGIHRDPTYYTNPDKFEPERFSNENKWKINPYTYLPFGAGPRNCIGSRFALLEIKALFYHLVLNFEIEATIKTTIPLKLSAKSFQPAAEGGFWLGLRRIRRPNK